jgi:hypothetical protein
VTLRFVIPFFGLLAAIGVAILVATQMQVRVEEQSFDWRSTTGTVRASEVIERPTPTRRLVTFEPRVTYGYRVGETEYESDRIGFGDHFVTSRADAEAIVARYPAGATVEVFYDPERPRAAVLEPAELGGIRLSAAVGILLIVLPLLVIGALLIGLARKPRHSHPPRDA